jgi:hypothetical protein
MITSLVRLSLLGLAFVLVLGLMRAPAAWAAADRFVQDRFVIGFWVDPPCDAKIDQRYDEIAKANFSMAISMADSKSVGQQLAVCERNGLKSLVLWPADTPAEALPDGPACWGYLLRDEPAVKDFAALREKVDQIRKARPGRLAYINLLPNYANAEQMGAESYDDYVAKFMDAIKPDVLCMDHYPAMKPGADSRAAYCENLAVFRKYALRDHVPFWNFFNCMPFGPHADPTESQLRWQIYTSLAYGAKGVLYFCYYTPLSPEFPKGGAIIGRDDRPTRHYDEAQRINAAIRNLGPTLMQLTSTGVFRVKPEDDPAKALAGTPVKNLARADYDPPHDFLIGVFQHSDGRRAVLLNNYRHDFTAWPTVEFDTDPARVVEVSKKTGKEVPVLDDSPDMPGLQLSFDSGEGRLFLLPAP